VEATRLCKLRITFGRAGCAPASVTEKAHQSCSAQRAKKSHLSEAWTVRGEARAGEATSGGQRLQACDSRKRSATAGVTARDAGKRKVGKLARYQGPAAPLTLSSPGGTPGTVTVTGNVHLLLLLTRKEGAREARATQQVKSAQGQVSSAQASRRHELGASAQQSPTARPSRRAVRTWTPVNQHGAEGALEQRASGALAVLKGAGAVCQQALRSRALRQQATAHVVGTKRAAAGVVGALWRVVVCGGGRTKRRSAGRAGGAGYAKRCGARRGEGNGLGAHLVGRGGDRSGGE